ncbi:MAG TPA: hypothetical protein VJ484_10350 [Lysobacter sp.]|nr:hypothetical protein [Lysobacter sp.]
MPRLWPAAVAALLLLLIGAPAVEASGGTIRTDQSVDEIVIQQQQIQADAKAGRNGWDSISPDKKSELASKQQRIFALLEGKHSVADLYPSDQVELANALEWIKALATNAEDERQVCTRERTTGSNRTTTSCSTVGEIRRRREATKDAMRLGERMNHTQPTTSEL